MQDITNYNWGEFKMVKNISVKPMVAVVGAAFIAGMATTPLASAAENPFAAKELSSGYSQQVAMNEGKCGEGKCGGDKAKKAEGKCGEGKCGGDKAKKAEGKCGEGKCGGDKAKKAEGKCGEGKCGGSK